MVTIYNIKNAIFKESQPILVELRGLSTDTKPTVIENNSVENGSTFIEIDTGKIYFYDIESETWKEVE